MAYTKYYNLWGVGGGLENYDTVYKWSPSRNQNLSFKVGRNQKLWLLFSNHIVLFEYFIKQLFKIEHFPPWIDLSELIMDTLYNLN